MKPVAKKLYSMVMVWALIFSCLLGYGNSAAAAVIPEKMAGDEFNMGAIGLHGAVSTSDVQASQVGVDILKAGGNAVDAAVATVFAIGVVEPLLSGIGGCGMMTIYLAETDEYVVIEYMETVPKAVEPGWYNPQTDSRTAKNAAVPGNVYGLLTALEKYGTMSLQEIMAPAIKLAREGFSMPARLASSVADSYDMIAGGPTAHVYLDPDLQLPYNEGDTIVNEDLAGVLEAISKGGIEEFYRGETAEKIVAGLREGGSLMSMEDLADYRAVIREPIRTTYYGHEIVTPPPPSNGGYWLLQLLNILEHMDVAQYEPDSPEYHFLFTEANRIAMRDSFNYIGDPAFYNLPVAQLISKEYAEERAALIDMKAMKAVEVIPNSDLPVEKLEATAPDSQHTTHVSVIDEFGNIVSATNTLGNGWGCGFAIKGLGFYFNSHMGNIDHTNPESPDYVMAGKRVRSTITPSLVLKDGEPIMAIGSPGSLAISSSIALVLNNVLLYGMDVAAAINAPRALSINRSSATGAGLQLSYENRLPAELVTSFGDMGYTLRDMGEYNNSLGGIHAIYLDRAAGVFYAGADPRRGGKALGY